MIDKKIKKEGEGKLCLRGSGKTVAKYNYNVWILIWSRVKQNVHIHTHTHTLWDTQEGGKLELFVYLIASRKNILDVLLVYNLWMKLKMKWFILRKKGWYLIWYNLVGREWWMET